MIIFFDTSAWIKNYFFEEGTLEIQRFLLEKSQETGNIFVASAVTYAEMLATLRRGLRGGRITKDEYNEAVIDFKEKWEDIHVPQVNKEHIIESGRNAENYALKGCDAFQLASALVAHVDLFVCADNELYGTAREKGCSVWNPLNGDYLED